MRFVVWRLIVLGGACVVAACTSGSDPSVRVDAAPGLDGGEAGTPEDGGVDARADGGDGASAERPNLTLRVEDTAARMYFEPRGARRALTFQVEVENTGPGALVLGDPDTGPHFAEIDCDGSRGVPDFIAWAVRSPEGEVLADGTLPARCVADEQGSAFTCAHQGLSVGRRTTQPTPPHCAYADVTGLGAGEYVLEVVVNPTGAIAEVTLEDNTAQVPVAWDDHDVCRQGFCDTACCHEDPCAGGACDDLPDLAPHDDRAVEDVHVTHAHFAPDACAMQEGCVGAEGERRLLRFSSTIANWGPGDLALGRPEDHPDRFEWDGCHRHYHFSDFAGYRLLHEDGRVAAEGHKQSFCLFDALPLAEDAGPSRFTCGFQGISAGWGDVYVAGLDCQWIDITGVAPGRYLLEVSVNEDRALEESTYDNNVVRRPVFLYADGTACAPGDLPEGASCPPVPAEDP